MTAVVRSSFQWLQEEHNTRRILSPLNHNTSFCNKGKGSYRQWKVKFKAFQILFQSTNIYFQGPPVCNSSIYAIVSSRQSHNIMKML